jgi:adenylate cyclase class IV
MLEARAFVPEIDTTKKILEDSGALFKGEYRCRDLIFIPKKTDKPYGEEFLRLRINEKNIWNEKNVIVVIKQVQRKEVGKENIVSLRKEFETEKDGRKYVEDNFTETYTFDFEFTRTGWQYDLGDDQIDLERVDDVANCYTIEIKSKTVDGLKKLAQMFKLDSLIKGAMLGEMRRVLKISTVNFTSSQSSQYLF